MLRFRSLRACALVALLVAGAGCQSPDAPGDDAPTVAIPFRHDGSLDFTRGGEVLLTIDIEIADTDSLRERGLMQRTSLPDRSGMLFLMPSEAPQSFWMANTPLSLDFVFANSAGEIVAISKYARPQTPENIHSVVPALYVLEVPAGFLDTHGIIEGDRIVWERNTP